MTVSGNTGLFLLLMGPIFWLCSLMKTAPSFALDKHICGPLACRWMLLCQCIHIIHCAYKRS